MTETPAPYDYRPGPDLRTPVERLIDDVRMALVEKRPEEARAIASRAIELAPGFAPVWVTAGLAHRDLEEKDRALPFFHEAVRLDRTLAEGWIGLAETYADLRQYEMAVDAAREAAAVAPDNAAMRAGYARSLAELNRTAEAQSEIEAALRISPGERLYQRELARILRHSGQFSAAISVLERIRRRSKKDARFWGKDLAVLYLYTRDDRAAAWALSKLNESALMLHFFRMLFRSFLGIYSVRADGTARLEEFLSRADLEIASRVAAAGWFEIGIEHVRSGDFDLAIAAFEKADRLNPDWSEPLAEDLRIELGRAYSARSRSGEAIAAFRSATELRPRCARAWALLGAELSTAGRYDEAVDAMRKVPEVNPRVPEIWFNIGGLYDKAGRREEAIEAYREGTRKIESGRDRSRCWNNLGSILLDLGREDEAVEAFKGAILANRDNGRAWGNLGKFRGEQGRGPQAMICLENAVRLRPYALDYVYYLGMAAAMCGKPDRVAAMLERLNGPAPEHARQLRAFAESAAAASNTDGLSAPSNPFASK